MTGGNARGNSLTERLTAIITANLTNDQFGVAELAREMGMSRSYIHRQLKKLTNQSISHFIRNIRLNKAMEMLRETNDSASEVAYKVGFGSPAYFNRCFHKRFGYPPGEVRKRYLYEPLPPDSQNSLSYSEQEQKPGWADPYRKLIMAVPAIIVLVFISSIIYYGFFAELFSTNKKISRTDKSVMVLPFKNLSSDEANQYFADGIAEDILNHLSGISELRVISRTSTEQFRESKLSATEMADKLKVNYILEGSVRRTDEKIRISVQFIDARNDRHLWSENYDREMIDIFDIQSDIALKVAEELKSFLTIDEKQQIMKPPTQNTEAYSNYLVGRFFWNKRTEEGLLKSAGYFEKAIELDPDYALAHAGLADAYFILTWWRWKPMPEGYEEAKQHALRALSLDQNLAAAYATLGSILCYHDWNWEQSREMLIKAIQLDPDYATAHQYYSELLDILGEKDLARQHINIALELDPVVFMHTLLSASYYFRQGNYNEALKAFSNHEEINPEYKSTKYYYFDIYFKLGEHKKAIETFREILQRDFPSANYDDIVENDSAKTDFNRIFQWLIEQQKQKTVSNPYAIARWYALAGDKENALSWLEKAVDERLPPIPRINCDVDWDFLRSESRFIALIEKMGLLPDQFSSTD